MPKKRSHPKDRFYFGDWVRETYFGPVVGRLAMVVERRLFLPGKIETQIIGCPYCGEFHQHSPGEGWRVPHCSHRAPGSGEYYVLDGSHLQLLLIRLRRRVPSR